MCSYLVVPNDLKYLADEAFRDTHPLSCTLRINELHELYSHR